MRILRRRAHLGLGPILAPEELKNAGSNLENIPMLEKRLLQLEVIDIDPISAIQVTQHILSRLFQDHGMPAGDLSLLDHDL